MTKTSGLINLLDKHPDRVPIIVILDIPNQQRNKLKYLVPNEMTVGEFMCLVRRRMKLNSEQGVYMFVNNLLPSITSTMEYLYSLYKNDDECLYFTVKMENTFG